MKKSYFIKFAILLFPLQIFSQSSLIITADSVATTLAQSITGTGFTVSNATLICNGKAVGNFSYSGSNLGLTQGIILTTGLASGATYSTTNSGDPSTAWNTTYNDPNLTSINSGAINDVCLLAFDFVPTVTNYSLTFVFASSEYDGFVCSFNDGMGIFLTGSNPAGGKYNAQNIAVLPNGTPVSINNVNDGNANTPSCMPTNSNYFHDNLTTPNHDIAYPGYTIPITSVMPITPDSLYHIEFAIADAGDNSYDSGIFIQDSSFSCTGCTTGMDKLNKENSLLAYPNPTNSTLNIDYNYSDNEAVLQLTELSSGRVLINKNIPCHSTHTQIDMSELAAGVYSISVKSNNSAAKNIRVIKVQ